MTRILAGLLGLWSGRLAIQFVRSTMLNAQVHIYSTPVAVAVLGALGGFFLTGCNNGLPPRQRVVPVKGRVLAKGVPAANAKIFLVPLGEDRDALRPRATSGPDGTFAITTYEPGDGAPEGEYAVGISWRGPPRAGASAQTQDNTRDFGKDEVRLDFFRNRYRDPQRSGIKIKVVEGTALLPDFNLK